MCGYKIVSFSVVILLITVLFAGVTTVPAAAATIDTMQFRYNAAHTGDYSPVAGSTPPNDKLLWSVAIGSSFGGGPTIANGIVYVTAYANGYLYALNAMTGLYKWKFPTGNNSYETPPSPTASFTW